MVSTEVPQPRPYLTMNNLPIIRRRRGRRRSAVAWASALSALAIGAASASSPAAFSCRSAFGCGTRGTVRRRGPSHLHLAVEDGVFQGLRERFGGRGGKRNGADEREETSASTSSEPPSPPPTSPRVPFVIQRIGRGTNDEIEEITRLCVDVFFNDRGDAGEVEGGDARRRPWKAGTTTPWKAAQLAYLRNFQYGDIVARNAFRRDRRADLVVARRVRVAPDAASANGNRAGADGQVVYNAEELPSGDVYVSGDIIGYCEVSEKNFGLGGGYRSEGRRGASAGGSSRDDLRPYLSNLSVAPFARKSGVGSRLMDACEEAVWEWDAGYAEIVLQVEEDNPAAVQFYKRRGWEFVFADPTCRRFDTSGFFLSESRVTKYAMAKSLEAKKDDGDGGGAKEDSGSQLIRKLRNSFFVHQS
ncbi:hypothetical protein ACHAWF_007366 [Thalassiosira exigua]